MQRSRPTAKPVYKVRWGRLLHERFNDSDADNLFREALEKDPENAGPSRSCCRLSADGFDEKAAEYADKAIEIDPKLAEAHELLANLALENDNP